MDLESPSFLPFPNVDDIFKFQAQSYLCISVESVIKIT